MLLSGGACEIIDTSTDGWYKISSGGVTGYVSSQYIYTGDKAREVAGGKRHPAGSGQHR